MKKIIKNIFLLSLLVALIFVLPVSSRVSYPLIEAVKNNNSVGINNLLDSGVDDIDEENELGQSALTIAVDQENLEIVKLLLKAGARTDSQDIYGYTPLVTAIFKGGKDIAMELIKAKASIGNVKGGGYEAFMSVIKNKNSELIEKVIEAGLLPEDIKIDLINKIIVSSQMDLYYIAYDLLKSLNKYQKKKFFNRDIMANLLKAYKDPNVFNYGYIIKFINMAKVYLTQEDRYWLNKELEKLSSMKVSPRAPYSDVDIVFTGQ